VGLYKPGTEGDVRGRGLLAELGEVERVPHLLLEELDILAGSELGDVVQRVGDLVRVAVVGVEEDVGEAVVVEAGLVGAEVDAGPAVVTRAAQVDARRLVQEEYEVAQLDALERVGVVESAWVEATHRRASGGHCGGSGEETRREEVAAG
jgi:hypothetical protein